MKVRSQFHPSLISLKIFQLGKQWQTETVETVESRNKDRGMKL